MATQHVFPASLDSMAQLVERVGDEVVRHGLSSPRVQRLQVAVEEAVVNVISYSYGGSGGEIRVRIRRDGSRVMVDLEDDGPAFDPLSAAPPDVTLDLDARQTGGLGIMLIRRCTDDLYYRREGEHNILTLAVNI